MTKSPQAKAFTFSDLAIHRPRLARCLRIVRRRGPLVVATLVVGLAAAFALFSVTGVKYQSSALIVVAGSPNTATGADNLAATYAGLIPEDGAMQQALANAIGVTDPAQYPSVGKRLVATVLTNSAVVSLSFTASSAVAAQSGLHALVSDLTSGVLQWKAKGQPTVGCVVRLVGSKPVTKPAGASIAKASQVQYSCPVSSAIPLAPAAGYVVPVKTASTGVRSTPGATKTLALGGLLGLLLGLVMAFAWERSDPRTDDLGDLRSELQCPAWEGTFKPAAAMSLLAHWRDAVPDGKIQIGVVGVGRYDPAAVTELQRTIQKAARQGVVFRHVDLGGQSVLEGLDTQTPIVVLCVAQATPMLKLRETVRRLGELGHKPDWAFLVRKGRVLRLPGHLSSGSRGGASGRGRRARGERWARRSRLRASRGVVPQPRWAGAHRQPAPLRERGRRARRARVQSTVFVPRPTRPRAGCSPARVRSFSSRPACSARRSSARRSPTSPRTASPCFSGWSRRPS